MRSVLLEHTVRLMREFLSTTQAQAIIWVAVLLALLAVSYYVLRLVRDSASRNEPSALEMLPKFREMHSDGDLSDKEFRTIKNVLGAKFNASNEKGKS